MKHTGYLSLLLVGCLSACATGPQKVAQELQGNWQPVEAVLAGQPVSHAVLQVIHLKLDHGQYAVLAAGQPDVGTYSVDATAQPMGITIAGTAGPNQGKTLPAIFALKGDTLVICYDLSGAKRPTEFQSATGTQRFLVTYIRVKG